MPKEDLSWLDRGGEMTLVSLSVLRDLAAVVSHFEAPTVRNDTAITAPAPAPVPEIDEGGGDEPDPMLAVADEISNLIDRLDARLCAMERAREARRLDQSESESGNPVEEPA
jgi:hypothetical protein